MSTKVKLNWDKLDALLQFKVPLKFVAEYLGVSVDAVQRRIKEEKGLTFEDYAALKLQRTAVKLQQKAIEMALGGNTVMMIFSLKNLAFWADKVEVQSVNTNITIEDFLKTGNKEPQKLEAINVEYSSIPDRPIDDPFGRSSSGNTAKKKNGDTTIRTNDSNK